MLVPQFFKLSKLINERVVEDSLILKLLSQNEEKGVLKHPRVISFTSKFYDSHEYKSLREVYFED